MNAREFYELTNQYLKSKVYIFASDDTTQLRADTAATIGPVDISSDPLKPGNYEIFLSAFDNHTGTGETGESFEAYNLDLLDSAGAVITTANAC